jgi:hypothetical protein
MKALCLSISGASAIVLLSTSPGVRGQSDNFDSGSDAEWSKITSPTYPATYSFPADEFGGHAYRLQGAATPTGDPGRVVAYRTNNTYDDFYLAVDIVAWDLGLTNDQAFGLIARASDIATGDSLSGATFSTRINRFSSSDGSKGQVQVYSFAFGGPGQPSSQTFFTTLVPEHKYRFVFTGVGHT